LLYMQGLGAVRGGGRGKLGGAAGRIPASLNRRGLDSSAAAGDRSEQRKGIHQTQGIKVSRGG
jgi:hypothetical protein